MDTPGKKVRIGCPSHTTGNQKRGKVSPVPFRSIQEPGPPRRIPQHGGEKMHAGETTNIEDIEWLAWAQNQLKQVAGQERKISRDKFKAALNIKQSFFAERFFTLSDKEALGAMDLEELLKGLQTLAKGDNFLKLSFLFDVYDVDGKGTIDRERLKLFLASCTRESPLKVSEEHLNALTDALYKGADKSKTGSITFDELYKQLRKHPSVVRNLTISAAVWLRQSLDHNIVETDKPQNSTLRYIKNNMRTVICMILYWLINAGLFAMTGYRERQQNCCIIIARAFGMCLNFNCVFALALMLRYCITWIRNTKVGQYFPWDQSTMFHRMVGTVILVQALFHSAAHIGNMACMKAAAQASNFTNYTNASIEMLEYWEILFTTRAGAGFMGLGFVYLSGMILVGILLILCIFSLRCVRQSGQFKLFHWVHLLYLPFLVLLCLHGPIFWMILVGPAAIFIVEKICESKLCKRKKHGRFYIIRANLLPSKVTKLIFSRPPSFTYTAGDYIFVNIPAIAPSEWHPFTITSPPEIKEEFWIHVRSVGAWSNRLYDFFDQYIESDGSVNRPTAVCHDGGETIYMETVENGIYSNHHNNNQDDQSPSKRCPVAKSKKTHMKTFIDGPYGMSSQKIFNTEHVVLITSGSGTAPFASILHSIVHHFKLAYSQCPGCGLDWYDAERKKISVKKVDLIWINPDQRSYEWFISLIIQLEFEMKKKKCSVTDFLEMQVFMTAAVDKQDMKGIGLQLALESLCRREDGGPPTGLRIRTEPGRPNFDELFVKIAVATAGKIRVFFCGSPLLAKCVKKNCTKHGFKFSRVRF